MKRNGLHGLLRDLKKLSASLETNIEELERVLDKEREETNGSKDNGIRFSDAELKSQWQRLQFENSDLSQIESSLSGFVTDKSKAELRAFIRANELPIATKESRREIARQLAQLIKVGATVRGR